MVTVRVWPWAVASPSLIERPETARVEPCCTRNDVGAPRTGARSPFGLTTLPLMVSVTGASVSEKPEALEPTPVRVSVSVKVPTLSVERVTTGAVSDCPAPRPEKAFRPEVVKAESPRAESVPARRSAGPPAAFSAASEIASGPAALKHLAEVERVGVGAGLHDAAGAGEFGEGGRGVVVHGEGDGRGGGAQVLRRQAVDGRAVAGEGGGDRAGEGPRRGGRETEDERGRRRRSRPRPVRSSPRRRSPRRRSPVTVARRPSE